MNLVKMSVSFQSRNRLSVVLAFSLNYCDLDLEDKVCFDKVC